MKTKRICRGSMVAITLLITGLFFGVGAGTASAATIKILSDSRHAFAAIADTINQLLGAGHVGTDIIVHSTNLGASGPFSTNVSDALNAGATYYNETGATTTSAAPYQLFTTAATGYVGDTISEYNLSAANDIAHNYGYSAVLPAGTPPPAFHIAPGQASGPWTYPGVEWLLNAAEITAATSSLSSVVGANAGMLAALRYNHPTWNWFDVKAALRQTGTNWATGYNAVAGGYGFGTVSYTTANAFTNNQLLLQPPEVLASITTGKRIQFTIYPFKQTRRVKEVLYQFSSAPAFQAGEMTLGAIQALGGAKIAEYSDISATTTQPITASTTNAYFVWFTADNANDSLAKYSRIDTYSVLGPYSQAPAPIVTASINQGTYNSPQIVTLTCSDAGGPGCDKIYYTLDGSTPTVSSPQYTGSMTVSNALTLKFFATDLGGTYSDAQTKTYSFSGVTLGSNFQTFGTVGTSTGQFNAPYGVAFDAVNNKLYAVDNGNNRIVKMDSGSGGTTFGANFQSFGTLGLGIGQFNSPFEAAIDAAANKLYITDNANSHVVKMDSGSGGTTFGANFQTFGVFGAGSGQFNGISMTALDLANNKLYVVDNGNNRIVKMDAGDALPTTGVTPDQGTYTAFQTVMLNCADGGSGCNKTYYTLDGSTPTASSTQYVGPIVLPQTYTNTLKFFSTNNFNNSEAVNTKIYTTDIIGTTHILVAAAPPIAQMPPVIPPATTQSVASTTPAASHIETTNTQTSQVVELSRATTTPPIAIPSPLVIERNLAQGTRGNDVKQLQEFLAVQGYLKATPNGYYGLGTKSAIQRFQREHNIARQGQVGYGTVGPKTRAILNAHLATPASAQTRRTLEQQIQLLQQKVADLMRQVSAGR